MNEMTGMFGATYLRISRDKGENEDTLQNHRELMQAFCRENGYTCEVYEEIVSGGKHDLESRPELQKLIDHIERYQAIFAVSLDRLSRNGLVSQQIKQLCIDHDIQIITPSQSFDLSNSQEDRLLYDVSSLFATLEYEMIGRRNKVNKIQRAKRGEYVGGKPAYGYRRNPDTKKLEIHEPEAEVVRYIFKLHREGFGRRKIVDILNREGYKPQQSNAFRPPTIKRIIQNPVYKGTVVFQDRKRIKENGEYRYKVLDTITIDHAHPAIIPPEEWEQANVERMERQVQNITIREKPANKTGTTMLKDLLFCGACGKKLVIRKEKHGVYTIKPCDSLLPDCTAKCYNRGIKLEFLEAEVLLKLQAHKQRLTAHLELREQQEMARISVDLQRHLSLVDTQLRDNEWQYSNLIEMGMAKVFSHEELRIKKEGLLEQRQKLLATREKVQQRIRDIDAIPPGDRLTYMIRLLEEFQYQPAEEQNETLKQFIKRIHYMRTMPEEIRKLSTKNRERQAHPFSYTIEYF
ncbi:recombinase family protein [Paenibacillus sp. P96]|uniref:Recombinase family protein n=1 Tax=Paenibacillus zeirhizosphaerae TaxID=2987519 RepID=A0ABT9FWL1_9BACL|nr:recombinase family protein [Paenibacillus sp. P96]MDP4099123.1 recombinase family protein [Paenibacillus sp. P96]